METLLGKEGAYIDGIYICPHHPDKGFEGERPAYKIDCNCRKPKPGLLLQAAKDWNIDLSQSYMIGDSDRDVEAGNAAGCKQSFFIKTNEPDALLSIVNKII
jgi:D-glycero-D-manno-heptose 1,7-bisphosphate phosphatase